MSQVEWGLLLLAIMSSAVTSALGAGGGLMLLVGLPNLVAAPLVIPIHGVSCLVSNFSRLAIDWRMVPWQKVMLPYLPGALIGGVLGYFALGRFSVAFLPIILGVFILLVTWTQWVQRFGMWLHNMSLLGGVQTFFALFVGTLGWLSAPILLQKGLKKRPSDCDPIGNYGVDEHFKSYRVCCCWLYLFTTQRVDLNYVGGRIIWKSLGACFAHSD